ncbi:hypothetical protein Tco_0157283 [Tanacetum coccineum]
MLRIGLIELYFVNRVSTGRPIFTKALARKLECEFAGQQAGECETFSDGDDDDEDDDANKDSDAHDDDDDDDATESDDDGDNITHPKLYTFSTYYNNNEESEKQTDDDKVKDGEEDKEGDVTNVNLEGGDVDMTEDDTTKDTEDTHVTLTAATPVVQQQSSSVSDLVSKFISPTTDEAIATPATTTTIPPPLFPVSQSSQQTPVTTTTTTNPSTTPLPLPNFASVFGFNQRVTALESDLSKLKQSNPFVEAISSIPGIVNEYLGSKMKEAVDVAIQLKSNKLREEAKSKSRILNYLITNAETYQELELKNILMDKMEENKSIDRSDVQKNLYNALVKAYNTDKDLLSSYGDRSGKEAKSSKEPTHKESKTTSSLKGASRSQPTDLNETTHLEFITGDDDVIPARVHKLKASKSSFDEFMATPIDFSTFMINRLKIDHLTQELLTGPTYDLINGSHIHHNLSKTLPLIPNTQRRLVIPFDHFVNNDVEYLKGGSSSRKYTTSITKTKAVDYGQVKWIEDQIPRTTWNVDCDGIPKRLAMFLNLWRYKVVRHRYSNPMIQPEPEGSTQGYPLVSVEVLRVNSFTMKMEILLEPASNKLMVEHAEFDESNANVLERFYTSAGNPVKEILLKLNLPDHRILKDGGEAWTEKEQIDNFLKERRLMRSLEKFVGGRLYEGDLRLRQKNHMILSYDVLIIQVDPHGFKGNLKMEVYLIPADSQDS